MKRKSTYSLLRAGSLAGSCALLGLLVFAEQTMQAVTINVIDIGGIPTVQSLGPDSSRVTIFGGACSPMEVCAVSLAAPAGWVPFTPIISMGSANIFEFGSTTAISDTYNVSISPFSGFVSFLFNSNDAQPLLNPPVRTIQETGILQLLDNIQWTVSSNGVQSTFTDQINFISTEDTPPGTPEPSTALMMFGGFSLLAAAIGRRPRRM